MKEVSLTKGFSTVVDDSDYEKISKHKWYASVVREGLVYAVRKPQSGIIYMHRIIMDAPIGMEVDHIDGNGLNNCRQNLRIATHSQNMENRLPQCNNKSGYGGVSWEKRRNTWRVRVKVNGKEKYGGQFPNVNDAIKQCVKLKQVYFGDFVKGGAGDE